MKLTLFFLLVVQAVWGYDSLRQDLSYTWKKFEDGQLQHFSGSAGAIHFNLTNEYKGILEIKSPRPFSIFLNNQLVASDIMRINWPVDSLSTAYLLPLQISIFSEQGFDKLSTQLIYVSTDGNLKKALSSYPNAVIIASFLLLVSIVTLIRTGPQTIIGYFNVVKIFSFRNTDEGVVSIRATSLNNVFVYVFCAGLIAVNLMALTIIEYHEKVLDTLLELLVATVVIFVLLLSKIIIINSAATLFRVSSFAPSQFYNFVRLLLVCFSISSVGLLIIFMLSGNIQPWQPVFTGFMITALIAFEAVTFVKLNSRGGFTVFHLFSYLCASELIPMIILLNIFFS